jgi:hypothetical protein
MCEIWNSAWPYALGYGVAVLFGQLSTHFIMIELREKVGIGAEKKGVSQILGALEITIFTSALLAEHGEFIALWLGIKTVMRWRHWEHDIPFIAKDGRTVWVFGRNAYNVFLVGNGLVILFAAIGWKAVEFALVDKGKLTALLIAAALFPFVLWVWARLMTQDGPVEDSDPRLAKHLPPARD